MFTYRMTDRGSAATVYFSGDLDIDATEIIGEELAPALSDRMEIELDFADVPFVDSSGIGLLLTLINGIRERGGTVTIRRIPEDVQMVFSLLQLPDIAGIDVFPDMK